MINYICITCGTQYPKSNSKPDSCLICSEERQYIPRSGQKWTSLNEMERSGYKNKIILEELNLFSITTKPKFAIGQTSFLIKSSNYQLLWDCISYLDKNTIEKIKTLGGIDAIALSHPHYYSSQVEWAETFNIPIYIHEDDKEWIVNESDKIIFWSGEKLILNADLTLYRIGGHFKGGTVLHWNSGNEHKGILFSGDIIQVAEDQNWVSFMYSYPNLIPLPINKVIDMTKKVEKLKFDRIYSALNRVVLYNAVESVQKSAKRYIDAINGKLFDT